MNTETLARTTFVLDRSTAEQLAFLSRRMGVSRSHLVRSVLALPVDRMASALAEIPENPTPADLRRAAQAGLDLIDEVAGDDLAMLREMARD